MFQLRKVRQAPDPPATAVPSIAVATNLAADIIRSCDAGSFQKGRSETIAQKSLLLVNTVKEMSRVMEGKQLQDRVDEAVRVLERTRKSAQTWRSRNKIMQWIFQRDMDRRMDSCIQDLDTTIESIGASRSGRIVKTSESQNVAELDGDTQKNPGVPGGPEGKEGGGKSACAAATDYGTGPGKGNVASSEMEALIGQIGTGNSGRGGNSSSGMICTAQATPVAPCPSDTDSSTTEKCRDVSFGLEGTDQPTAVASPAPLNEGVIDLCSTGPPLGYSSLPSHEDGASKKSEKRTHETVQDENYKDQIFQTRFDCVKIQSRGNEELKLVQDEEVMAYFDGFDPDRVIRDQTCFYVTFNRPDSARRAQQICSTRNKALASLSVLLSIQPAPHAKDNTHPAGQSQERLPASEVAVSPSLPEQPFVASPTWTPLPLSHPWSHPAYSQVLVHGSENAIAQSKNNYARDGPSSPTQTSLSLAAGAFSAPAFPPVAPPRNFDVCRSLLLQLVAQRNSIPRRIINHITEEDAQSTIDFLDKVLDNGKDLGIDESKRILHFLESIAKLFQVFPARCKLKDLQFDPSKPLYEGGYGYVCRGIYRNISVCVKVVRLCQQPSDNVTNLKAQAKEFALWAHLSHPNIVPFYGIHLSDEYRICLVSPWMQRGDLKRYLRAFPATPRLPLLVDVIFGLRYLHGSNIIHADIKASNILVSNTGRAMIADFGISHVAMTCATSTDLCKGTPRWTAPELVRNSEARPSPESDVWSFACLCYEVLTGRVPFYQLKTNVQMVIALIKGDVTPLEQSPKDSADQIDADMRNLLKDCWRYDPKERPSVKYIIHFFEELNIRPSMTNDDLELRNAQIIRPEIEVDYGRVFEVLHRLQPMQEGFFKNYEESGDED